MTKAGNDEPVVVARNLTKHFGERVAGQALDAVALHIVVLAAYAAVGYLAASVFIRRRLIQ